MRRLFLRFNLFGVLMIAVGACFVFFNIPVYTWLIVFGIVLIITGLFLCR